MGAPLLSYAKPELIQFFGEPLAKIGARINDPNYVDDVKRACLNRRAFLFIGHEGFSVLKPIVRDDHRGVLIWAAHSTVATNRPDYLEEFERLTRMIDGTFIELWTARKGFARILPKFGYTSRAAEWCETPVTVWTKQL
jgi:hypothetical protein